MTNNEAIGNLIHAIRWNDMPKKEALEMAIQALKQKPTITSTNISGEMVYPQVEGITPTLVNEDIYQCSCGYGWDKNKVIRFHFCPNCGAKMESEVSE